MKLKTKKEITPDTKGGEVSTKKENQIKDRVFKISLLGGGVLVGIILTFVYIQKFGIPFQSILRNVVAIEQSKVLEQTLKKVEKLIVLPTDETPVTATITDIENLKKQEPFYLDAQNGDVVLMYQKALKAIIYNPQKDIIVNVGPIYVPSEEQKQAESVSQESEGLEAVSEE